MRTDPVIALQQHRAWVAQNQENTARLAQSFGVYTTTGWGEFKDPNVIAFNCTFLNEPFLSHGYSLNGDKLVATRFPRAWGFVHQWRQDHRGYYTGAWVTTVVETQSPYITTTVTVDPNYSIDHCFTFTGIALKDLLPHLLDK